VTAFADDFGESDPTTIPFVPVPGAGDADRGGRSTLQAADRERGSNFYLAGDRGLAKGWKERARDNLAAIRLAAEIEADERPATAEEQEQLIRFTGFGASELANGVFRRPGESISARAGRRSAPIWRMPSARATTPRSPAAPNTPISRRSSSSGRSGRACSARLARRPRAGAGHRHGAVSGADAGGLRDVSMSPASSSIRSPHASPGCCSRRRGSSTGDFARTELPASFDLAIGNPPFSDRTVRSDRAYRSMACACMTISSRARSTCLKPGALAAFVTSSGTMDKADARRASTSRSRPI
jgi:hypothetical protein